ncbi:MAG: PAS domain S-box protein [Rhodospirillales bacterium]|nr:PAS domain S-box protein [Rhodospirillales bacterium]
MTKTDITNKEKKQSDKAARHAEHTALMAYCRVCFVAFVGTVMSILFFIMVLNQNVDKLEDDFRHDTTMQILSLNHKTRILEQFWEDMQAFYLSSETVTLQEFGTFSASILKQGELGFISWLPDTKEPLDANDIYMVSKKNVDQEQIKKLLIEEPAIREAIEKARTSLSVTISRDFSTDFMDKTDPQPRVAIAIPTMKAAIKNEGPRSLNGFSIAFLETWPFFSQIFLIENRDKKNIQIFLTDADESSKDLLFKHTGQENMLSDTAVDNMMDNRQMLAVSQKIPFASQYLKIEVSPSFSYLAQSADKSAWAVFLLGMALTGFIAFWFYQQISRTLHIQHIVNEKTEALSKNEKHLRAILDNTVDGIITINSAGIIQTFNSACERIFGYNTEEVIGENINLLMPPPDQEKHDSYIANYIRTGEAKIIGIGREVVGLRKDGSTFPMDLGIGVIKNGGDYTFIGIIRDITDRKEAERQLTESHQAMDDFVYIVSHDLKEPLRGIYSYAQFLMEDYGDTLNEDGIDKLNTLKNLSRRMEELIDTLLYYSRLGRTELAFKETDINRVLKKTMELLEPTIQEQNVTVNIHEKMPTLVCDRARVSEIFRNLITNAIKYNDNEEKYVEVGCIVDHPDFPYQYVFYVEDNGIGIPEKHQDAVFKIFKRLHARDAYGGGTGSGLTIVKKIIDRHNGKIWIESDGKNGTTFYFTLSDE